MGCRASWRQWRTKKENPQGLEWFQEDEGNAGSFVHDVFRSVYLVRGDSPEPKATHGGDACRSHGCNAGGSAAAGTSATGDTASHSGCPQCNQWGDPDSVDLDQHGADGGEQPAAVGGVAAAVDQSGQSAGHADDRTVPQPDGQHLPHKAQ